MGDTVAIEVKAHTLVSEKHMRGLRALKEENIQERFIVVSQDQARRVTSDKIEIIPWREFLLDLWEGKIVALNQAPLATKK